jgi:predicted ArsR family transcriptional regulator
LYVSDHRPQGTTRNTILQLLRRRGAMTAGELSDQLGVGAVGVRQHLGLLYDDGFVTTVGVRRGMGRPSHLYALTDKAEQLFPRAYEGIALEALNFIAGCGCGEVARLFEQRRCRLAAQYREHMPEACLEGRMGRLAQLLNEQGYMCEWGRDSDGSLTLVQHNCPIDCIARCHPEACASELRLYEELIGVPLEQVATIANGAASCRYRVVTSEQHS